MVGYYVTLRRGSRTAWLAGPFATLPDAVRTVDAAVAEAERVDSMTAFDAHGTARLERPAGLTLPAGKLNDRLDLVRGANGYVRVAARGAHASGRARRRGVKGGAIRLFATRTRTLPPALRRRVAAAHASRVHRHGH